MDRSLRTVAAASVAAPLLVLIAACARAVLPGDPVQGLDRKEMERFAQGKVVFDREFRPDDGLGPLFNAVACGECHEEPASGGVGDEIEVQATAHLPSGTCDQLESEGGVVVQTHTTPALEAALGLKEEPVPAHATATGKRTTPDILGFGMLDAVPEKTILALADPDDHNHDGISGRVNRGADGHVGRFGRKAQVSSLRDFNVDAFLFEQGITSPARPHEERINGAAPPEGTDPAADPEITQEEFDRADFFVRTLAPVEPLRLGHAAKRGSRVFAKIGCTTCHVPRLKTGASPIKALDHEEFLVWTDLLLHDMGPDLADVCLALASPSEWRTEPLSGLRLSTAFLHDGRAKTIEEAIRLHGGEAQRSRDRFAELSEEKRRDLLAFLGCL